MRIRAKNVEKEGLFSLTMGVSGLLGNKFGAELFYLIFIMNKKQEKILDYNSSYRSLLTKRNLDPKEASLFVNSAKNNIPILMEILSDIYQLLLGLKNERTRRVHLSNCLIILGSLLQTCEYVPVIITEIYLLAPLEKLLNDCSNFDLPSGQFGYSSMHSNAQMRNQTYQYEALLIILTGASIKPNRYYQKYELNEPSFYTKAVAKVQKLFKKSDMLQLVNRRVREKQQKKGENIHQKFDDKVKEFFDEGNLLNHQFKEYFLLKVFEAIENGPKGNEKGESNKKQSWLSSANSKPSESGSLNIWTFIKFGNGQITSDVLGVCVEILEGQTNISLKRNALYIIAQITIWGDNEALLMINYSNIFEDLTSQIEERPKMRKRWTIFPNIEGQQEQKLAFLKDLLNCIELWGKFMPYDNLLKRQSEESSTIHDIYIILKTDYGINFPENPLQKYQTNTFHDNLRKNLMRNNKIIELLHQQTIDSSSFNSFSNSRASSKPSQLNQNPSLQSILEESMRKGMGCRIRQTIENSQNILNNLQKVNEKDAAREILKMKREKQNLEEELDLLAESMSEGLDQNKLILEGETIIKNMNKILKFFKSYENKFVSFNNFISEVANSSKMIRKCSQEDHNKFEVSSQESMRSFILMKYRGDNSVSNANSSSSNVQQSNSEIRKTVMNQNPQFKAISNSLVSNLLPIKNKEQALACNFPGESFSIKSPSQYSQYSQSSASRSKRISEVSSNDGREIRDNVVKENIVGVREQYFKRGPEPRKQVPKFHRKEAPKERASQINENQNKRFIRSHTVGIMVTLKQSCSQKEINLPESPSISSGRVSIFKGRKSEERSLSVASDLTSKNIFRESERASRNSVTEKQSLQGAETKRIFFNDYINEQYLMKDMIQKSEHYLEIREKFDDRTKKKLMRSKNLIIKNDELEIGSSIKNQGSTLVVFYFITPSKDLFDFAHKVSTTQELSIKNFPLTQKVLSKNKQYRLSMTVDMLQYAFKLPKIQFSYKWNENGKRLGPRKFISLLPILSIKFLQSRVIEPSSLEREFSIHPLKETHEINIEKSFLREGKIDIIHRFIPNLVLFHQQPGLFSYGTQFIFKRLNFMMKVCVKTSVFGKNTEEGYIKLSGIAHEQKSRDLMIHCLCMFLEMLKMDDKSELQPEPTEIKASFRSPFKKNKQ